MLTRYMSILLGFLIIFSCTNNTIPSQVIQDESEKIEEATGLVAFAHVNVIPMTEDIVLSDRTVLIDDGIIIAITPAGELAIPDSFFVIDGSGKYLMPGLTDMHTHIYFEEDLLPYIANGVTTILNMGSPATILQFRDRVASGELLGPNIFASAFVDGPGGRGGQLVKTPDEATSLVATISSQGWDFIKAYNSIETPVYDALMIAARHHGIAVIGHGVRAPGIQKILADGQVMIAHAEEYLYTYFNNARNTSRIPGAVEITRNAGAFVTPNLSTFEIITKQWGNRTARDAMIAQPETKYLHPNWLQDWQTSNLYINNSGSLQSNFVFLKQLVKGFSDGGVPLLLGTDSPIIPGMMPGFTIHNDLRNLVELGMTPYQALQAGTQNSGEFIERYVTGSESFGTIETEQRADLVLLPANPLQDISNLRQRSGVMVRGRWLSQGRLQKMLEEMTASF